MDATGVQTNGLSQAVGGRLIAVRNALPTAERGVAERAGNFLGWPSVGAVVLEPYPTDPK